MKHAALEKDKVSRIVEAEILVETCDERQW